MGDVERRVPGDARDWDPFASVTEEQRRLLEAYQRELLRFNRKINLISADTEPHFWERHILHSLALSYRSFPAGSVVVDWGAGGGLPSIPLAIRFPDVTVHAVDAVGKKMQTLQVIRRRLALDNHHPWHGRAEEWTGRATYSVSRATAPLLDLWTWHARIRLPSTIDEEAYWRPGLICLKGGDLGIEVADLEAAFPGLTVRMTPLRPLLGRSYFADKVVVEVFDGSS